MEYCLCRYHFLVPKCSEVLGFRFFSSSFGLFFSSFKEKLKTVVSPGGGLSMDVAIWKIIFILHLYGLFYNVLLCLLRKKEGLQ